MFAIIFKNGVKRHICNIKNYSRLVHALPISVNDRMIWPFRVAKFSRNFAYAKINLHENYIFTRSFAKIKLPRKFPYKQYTYHCVMLSNWFSITDVVPVSLSVSSITMKVTPAKDNYIYLSQTTV